MLPFEIPGLSAVTSAFTRSAMPFIGSLAVAHALRRPGSDPMATVNEAISSCSERSSGQEQELSVLVDGVDSGTHDKLAAISGANDLVGEYLALIPVAMLPDAW